MNIICTDIAKKYFKEVLFSGFSYKFEQGQSYAILGPNSSGKSTLLRILGGTLDHSKGKVEWYEDGEQIARERLYEQMSFSSPAMQLPPDFTVQETIDFHFSLKNCKSSLEIMIDRSDLRPFLNKLNRELSSGLQNKIKLALALFSEAEVLMLDEPCTNFDDRNTNWYQSMIREYGKGQLIIIASNSTAEYEFCDHTIHLTEFKN